MNRSLNTLFNNLRNKQKMNTEEFESLKKTIFMRIGLGLKFLPFYRFLPSSLFKIIFFCFSPLYLKKIYSSLSSINRLIKF